jgi:hypothetical protein
MRYFKVKTKEELLSTGEWEEYENILTRKNPGEGTHIMTAYEMMLEYGETGKVLLAQEITEQSVCLGGYYFNYDMIKECDENGKLL